MPQGKEVTMESINGAHLYCADGKTYPSVTTILSIVAYSQQLMKWANSLGMRRIDYQTELDRTAVQGTYVHEINQCIVDPENGKMPAIGDPLTEYRVRKRVNNFKAKLDEHDGHWSTIFAEKPFVSHTYELGGTMDWCANWYEKTTLFDYKTSAAVRDKHVLQLGGYNLMLHDNGIDIDQGGIILCKEDRCLINIFDKETLDKAADIFLSIYDYYKKHDWLANVILNGATTI